MFRDNFCLKAINTDDMCCKRKKSKEVPYMNRGYYIEIANSYR